MAQTDGEVSFSASLIVEYAYRRSVGAVLGHFFTGLRDRKLIGTRTRAGRVLVPPCEYDPDTGEAVDEFVDVGPAGVVTTWAWVHKPSAKHPLPRAFAWALVQLDGADTAMLHAVDAGSESRMRTGMRVQPRWREKTVGEIQDIECFEPAAAR